jgi:hypothetical protein
MKKKLLYFTCLFFVCLTSLNAQEMRDGALRGTSIHSESFKPFHGDWEAEKAFNNADKTKPNYSLDMSYKVYDKKTDKLIADSKQGDKLEPLGWKNPTVNISQVFLKENNYYKLKTIDRSNIYNSYSFSVKDYKNCFTETAVKLTILPNNQNELIWKSEILESQNGSYEQEFNCTILEPEELNQLTIPQNLTFKRVK